MGLATAANKFRSIPIEGWDGTSWAKTGVRGTFLAYDRFVSEREYGSKLRNFLVPANSHIEETYSLIRFPTTGKVFMLRLPSEDVDNIRYSTILSLRSANYLATVSGYVASSAVSGLPTAPQKTVKFTSPCDVVNITVAALSTDYNDLKTADDEVYFPNGTVVSTTDEIQIGAVIYDIKAVFMAHNLVCCRCNRKLPA